MKLDIRALLAEHPNMHIHFCDKDRWMLFHDKAACDAFEELECREGLLADGDDEYVYKFVAPPSQESSGYLPVLVEALAAALGITTDSV